MAAAVASGALTRHGFPRGYRFVPSHLEMIQLLADRLRYRPLPKQVDEIFNDINILDYHPQQLYEEYREYQEAGCIYFFSQREFPASAAGVAGDGKKQRPVRATHGGGGWKPSGGAKPVENEGGSVVGRRVTMVFYDRVHVSGVDKQVKTEWGLHEYTVPVGPDKFSKMAVYRLYKVKNAAAKARNQQQQQANGAAHIHVPAVPLAVAGQHMPSTSAAAAPPSYAAGASATGQAFFSASHQEQNQLVNIEETQYHHNQYALGAAAMPGQSTWAPPPAAVNPLVPVPGALGAAAMPGQSNWAPQPMPVAWAPPPMPIASALMPGQSTRSPLPVPVASTLGAAAMPGQSTWAPTPAAVNLPVPVAAEPRYFMFDDSLLFNGDDITFTMEELLGTDNNSPSTGDRNSQAGVNQEPPPAAF